MSVSVSVWEESEAVPALLPTPPPAILTAVGALTSCPGIHTGVSQDSPHSNSLPHTLTPGENAVLLLGLLVLALREALPRD